MSIIQRRSAGAVAVVCLLGLVQLPSAQVPPPPQVFAAIYSRGPVWTDDATAFAHPSLKAHVQHFQNLGDRLLGAAPFALDASDPTVGMVRLLADSETAAREWGNVDPAVVANLMKVKVHRWRVSSLRPFGAGR